MFINLDALMKTRKVSLFNKARFLEIEYASIMKILNNVKYDFMLVKNGLKHVCDTFKLSQPEDFFVEAL